MRGVSHQVAVPGQPGDSFHGHFRRSGGGGFTLPELLVVIGLIATLVAILLPVLSKAREAANQVKCMSNLRQLSAAFMMYANNNRGSFPGAALGEFGASVLPSPADWIYWQSGRDINQSAIAPYLGARGGTLRSVLRCPTDSLIPRHSPWADTAWLDPYNYSYQMNWLLDGNPYFARSFYDPPRVGGVRHASEKILLGEPEGRLIQSGSWNIGSVSAAPSGYLWRPVVPLSIRHDQPGRLSDPLNDDTWHPLNADRRGNVALCDGHVEFVPRSFAASREHADPRY